MSDPVFLKTLGWEQIKQRFSDVVRAHDSFLGEGLTPHDLDVENETRKIKYHLRAGMYSFLSEHYQCTFQYEGNTCSSVQQAYQVGTPDRFRQG